MPSVNFNVQWPDGELSEYYSPSTIIYEYFNPGNQYALDDFKQQSLHALDAAAKRVKERFGYYCSAASAEQEKIIYKHAQLKQQSIDGTVIITEMSTANEYSQSTN